MKWIGQHIWSLITRFRSDVYFENLQGSSETTALVVDSDGKVTTNSLSGGSGDSEASKVRLPVRFKEAVVKGDPVYISGYNNGQNRAEVQKADCDDANKMPSFGLADADYSLNDNGYVISIGNLEDVDTQAYSVGDTLYVASGGGLTNTKPATEAKLIQNVGVVTRSNQNNGQIEVVATGRSNDVPNLDEDAIFLGNASNQMEQVDLSSVGLSKFNNDSGFTTNTGDITGITISDGVTNHTTSSGTHTTQFLTGEGIDVTVNALSGTVKQVTYSAENASTSNKGVASFNSGNFSVSSGAVDLASTISVGSVTIDDKIQHDGDTDTFIHFGNGGNDTITLTTGNVEKLYITNSNTTFNENGNDIDFRVEGSGEANALFVQGSDGNVGVGTGTPSSKLEVSGAVKVAGKITNVTDPTSAQDAATKNYVDGKYSYQYISFTGAATVPADGDWMTVSANGISNHTWNVDLGSGGTTIDTSVDWDDASNTSSTVTIPKTSGNICQGIIVPYNCILVGYSSLIRSIGNHQSKVGLAVGVPIYNDYETYDATLVAFNAADISAGPDTTNYSQRPTRADYLTANAALPAGYVIHPLIGSVASNSRTVQWNCTLVLKTLLP